MEIEYWILNKLSNGAIGVLRAAIAPPEKRLRDKRGNNLYKHNILDGSDVKSQNLCAQISYILKDCSAI